MLIGIQINTAGFTLRLPLHLEQSALGRSSCYDRCDRLFNLLSQPQCNSRQFMKHSG
jgi:hypothetical protein